MAVTEQITSIKDPRIVEARDLTSASGRTRQGKCLLEGVESISWALEALLSIEHVFYSTSLRDNTLLETLLQQHIPCYAVSDGMLKKITDTSYVVSCVGVARIPDQSTTEAMGDFIVVLDRVQDHGNIGTIIRTASAFGIRDLVSTRSDTDIYYKKVVTASRGKAFEVRLTPFASGPTAIAELKSRGYQIVATSPHATEIQSMAPLAQQPVALVVGNETEGISDEVLQLADVVVQIPMTGMVESLNVGVATGISVYELKFRMVLTMLTHYIRSNFGREVNVTGQMIMQAFNAALKQVSDLNSLQVVLLMQLKCDQSMTMEQVSKDTATFGGELTELLHPLFEHKYIQYTTPDTLELTSEGERTLAQLWNVVERAENQVLAGFTEAEKQQLNEYLKRIQQNCMQQI